MEPFKLSKMKDKKYILGILVTAILISGITDVLNGYQQQITVSNENGNLAIRNLIVRDYPLVLQYN